MDALTWLFGLADSERTGAAPSAGAGWNLRRTRALLDLDGAPDRRMTVVLVAGTKGKGSTSAMLASILARAGIRAGLYTQPHLQRFEERIRIDGVAITRTQLRRAAERMRRLTEELDPLLGQPTLFEVTTALAVSHFARARCAAAVVEVGIGGRLDATNALDPTLSIITPISHDHIAILGRTLPAIAREKAGIARRSRTLLVARQPDPAAKAIARSSTAVGARLRVVGPEQLPARLVVGLLGAHQRQNAALARAAALALGRHGHTIRAVDVAEGLRRARWPGRLEITGRAPVVVIDGAHNDGSASALAAALSERFPGRRIHLVIGVLRDKDARAVLRPLLPLADRVWACRPPVPRGLPAAHLAAIIRELSDVPLRIQADPETAISAARAAEREAVVCIAGSLALAGAARDALGLPWPRRLWVS